MNEFIFTFPLITPTTTATDSGPIIVGAAMIIDKSPTPVIPKPTAAKPRIVSTEIMILAHLLYFLPSSLRLPSFFSVNIFNVINLLKVI